MSFSQQSQPTRFLLSHQPGETIYMYELVLQFNGRPQRSSTAGAAGQGPWLLERREPSGQISPRLRFFGAVPCNTKIQSWTKRKYVKITQRNQKKILWFWWVKNPRSFTARLRKWMAPGRQSFPFGAGNFSGGVAVKLQVNYFDWVFCVFSPTSVFGPEIMNQPK